MPDANRKSPPKWRVWYDDGTVYDSCRRDWAGLPDDGLLVKMLYYDDGTRQIQQGADYYFVAPHAEGDIHGASSAPLEVIRRRYPGAIVKRGRWAPDGYYRRICEEAHSSRGDDG